jgi:hypothetical protein
VDRASELDGCLPAEAQPDDRRPDPLLVVGHLRISGAEAPRGLERARDEICTGVAEAGRPQRGRSLSEADRPRQAANLSHSLGKVAKNRPEALGPPLPSEFSGDVSEQRSGTVRDEVDLLPGAIRPTRTATPMTER